MKRTQDTIRLLDEAMKLEAAGGTWTQSHVAAVTGYSIATIRASNCPKHYEQGPTTITRPRLVYLPSEVRRWKASLLRKAS